MCACVSVQHVDYRGIWGHPLPRRCCKLDALRLHGMLFMGQKQTHSSYMGRRILHPDYSSSASWHQFLWENVVCRTRTRWGDRWWNSMQRIHKICQKDKHQVLYDRKVTILSMHSQLVKNRSYHQALQLLLHCWQWLTSETIYELSSARNGGYLCTYLCNLSLQWHKHEHTFQPVLISNMVHSSNKTWGWFSMAARLVGSFQTIGHVINS